jgi:hypothetical protein
MIRGMARSSTAATGNSSDKAVNSSGSDLLTHRQRRTIHEEATRFFDAQPFTRIPCALDVVELLERIAWHGVRLPNHFVLLRKVLFTLDGILHDVAGSSTSMEFLVIRRLVESWAKNPTQIGWPLPLRDWIAVSLSATLYGSRVAVRGLEQLAA